MPWQDKGTNCVSSFGAAVMTCVLLTWANPHVYLDTVVLLGGISAQYAPAWAFGVGGAVAPVLRFSSRWDLEHGCCGLSSPIRAPGRFLDVLVGLTMWAIAAKLVWGM